MVPSQYSYTDHSQSIDTLCISTTAQLQLKTKIVWGVMSEKAGKGNVWQEEEDKNSMSS